MRRPGEVRSRLEAALWEAADLRFSGSPYYLDAIAEAVRLREQEAYERWLAREERISSLVRLIRETAA